MHPLQPETLLPAENAVRFNPALHRFAIFLGACTFLLIVAGALVTSHDAGLSVPDWPTSFGSLYKVPPMVGGVKYEHGHRMLAQFIGLLTIALAVWIHRSDNRPWMRKLGWTALALVVVQGILGGITVLTYLPWYVSTGHAMLAQTFFALTLLFVVFSGRRWVENQSRPGFDEGIFSLRALSASGTSVVYMQLFLGAAFRHGGMHFLPHIIGAVFATAMLLWLAVRALSSFSQIKPIRGVAVSILALLIIQLSLGFAAYLTRVEWGHSAAQPTSAMVWTTVAHVTVGALLLAHCFIIAAYAFRYTSVRQPVSAEQCKAVIA